MSDTASLDRQIRDFAARRAAMRPSHPVTPPIDPAEMHRADNMLWHVRPAPGGGGVEIALYHPGLGWTGMVMSRAQIEDLQDTIAASLRELPVRLNPASQA